MLTPQALTILIVYVLLSIVVVALAVKSASSSIGVVGALTWILYVALMVRGNCNVWSWVRTVLYILLPVVLLVVLSIALFGSKDKEDKEDN